MPINSTSRFLLSATSKSSQVGRDECVCHLFPELTPDAGTAAADTTSVSLIEVIGRSFTVAFHRLGRLKDMSSGMIEKKRPDRNAQFDRLMMNLELRTRGHVAKRRRAYGMCLKFHSNWTSLRFIGDFRS